MQSRALGSLVGWVFLSLEPVGGGTEGQREAGTGQAPTPL